ncbi:MAG: hypothetical protein Q8K85_24805 [Hyphomicrobium sp.]|nr:hypothetical protein [Hyphomicrobium sp.]
MDQSESSPLGALVLFAIICSAIFVTWIVLGPGDQWAAALIAQAQAALQMATNWYQKTVDGPSKLIAPAITIASGSYAIYKGYKYADARLHYRLGDYLAREERRLADARKQLRLIIERPNVERRFREPIFLAPPLKRAVRNLGWGSYFLGPQLGYVSFQLDGSITQLDRQVKLAKDHQRHLERQLATAHLLKGAMCVAEGSVAEGRNEDGRVMVSSALNHFQSALAVDANDCEALEYAGHMHVSLRQDQDAELLLDRLLDLTSGHGKSLTRARAFRYKADISASRSRNGVARTQLNEALRFLPNLHGEDRVEEAEIHEALADRQNALNFHRQARSHWGIAEALYGVIGTSAASAGQARVGAKLAQLTQQPDGDQDADDTAA